MKPWLSSLLLTLAASLAAPASAADYPTQPVRIVVPFDPAAAPTWPPAPSRSNWPPRSASRSWSRTGPAAIR